MKILKASKQDIHLIAELFNQYRIFYHQPSNITLAQSFLEERMSHKESVIFYAADSPDKVVGFTQLYPLFSSISAKKIWQLNDLYVLREERNKGIGKLLLNQARKFAKKDGATKITLETEKSNYKAQHLYESLGYKKDIKYDNFSLTIELFS